MTAAPELPADERAEGLSPRRRIRGAGGNPGASLQVTMTASASGGALNGFEHNVGGNQYNPAVDGAVASIDFTIDARWISSSLTPGGHGVIIAIQQAGIGCASNPTQPTGFTGTWVTLADTGLHAWDFTRLDGLSGTPDLSASGAPFSYGLRTAQEWRTRLGFPRREDWDATLKGLSPLPVQEGRYVLHEGVKDMWTKWNLEHPALIGTFGMLPGDGVDRATMQSTLQQVSKTWDWSRTWGWDFPMLAMTAARLGEPEQAIDFLLTAAPGFQFDERGVATGGPFPYFPCNGGLLYAVAMMAAGWDGSPPDHPAPGFPNNGKWKVRYEGLVAAP